MTLRDAIEMGVFVIIMLAVFAVTIGVSTLATLGWWWLMS